MGLTLGSLFDGSGGFPLGGLFAGITTLWSSEIEPFPIRVTTKRLPNVKHYGDVSKINGAEIEPVDIITFGSPCQDMSVAGKRVGLEGSRSSLFRQAIRIIKEMRCATNGEYPRFIVWENVPGAFSSNKGEDFKAVLEAVCSVKDEDISVPEPPKGKWSSAGEIMADGFSLAWRVLDAQFWGVPQRRKRIYLVADFAGGSAGQILFESEGLSGYSPQGFRSWQGTACRAEIGTGATGYDGYNGRLTGEISSTLGVNCGMSTGRNGIVLNDQGGNRMDVTDDVTCTLRAEAHHPPCVMDAAGFCTEHSAKARGIGYEEETSPTLRAGVVPATVPLTLKIRSGCEGGGKGPLIQTDKSATLSCHNDQTLFEPCAWDGKEDPPVVNDREQTDRSKTVEYIVRRLTPTECARLQGFPDWWCAELETPEPAEDEVTFWREVFETHRKITGTSTKPKTDKQIIKWLKNPHSDSAEYKMWGNGVALPNVIFVLSGISYYSEFT